MRLEEAVVEKLRDSPPERQREVLDFVEFLKSKSSDNQQTVALARMLAASENALVSEDYVEELERMHCSEQKRA